MPPVKILALWRWLAVAELAAYLGCSRRTAERFIDRTGIQKVRFAGGRRVVVDRRAVDWVLEEMSEAQMYEQPEWKRELGERLAKYKKRNTPRSDDSGTRKPISSGLRFRIFQRDGFECFYCGKAPPQTELQIDHIIPVSKGGTNSVENLVTACAECNRGKGTRKLAKYKGRREVGNTAGPPNDTPEAGEGDAAPASGDFFELEDVETEEAK